MIGDAIGLSVKVFDNSEASDRLLILLTDGNDTGSKVPPKKAAEIAAQNDVTIHTVAVGDPAAAGEAQMDTETLEASDLRRNESTLGSIADGRTASQIWPRRCCICVRYCGDSETAETLKGQKTPPVRMRNRHRRL